MSVEASPDYRAKMDILRAVTMTKSTAITRFGVIVEMMHKGEFGEAAKEAERIAAEARRMSHDVTAAFTRWEKEINAR